MDKFDSSVDELIDAPLTAKQRNAWNALRSNLAAALKENADLQERLQQYEQHRDDGTSTVLNRNEFNREAARMLAFDERYGGTSSVLYFDFDGIENVTAQFGRAITEAVVQEIATVLMQNLRNSDVIGRLAVDEFGVLLMRCDNPAAWRKAESLSQSLQQALLEIDDSKLDIKISYGAYTFRDNEELSVGLKEAAQTITCLTIR